MAGRIIRKSLQRCWYHSTGGFLPLLRVPPGSYCSLSSPYSAGNMANQTLSRWSRHTRDCSKWTEKLASNSSANERECYRTLFPPRCHSGCKSSRRQCIATGFSSCYTHFHMSTCTPANFSTSRTFSQLSVLTFSTPLRAHSLRYTPKQPPFVFFTERSYSSQSGRNSRWRSANRSTVTYMVAIAVTVVGLSYAAVPLYRLFCQASGYGGTVIVAKASEKVEKMTPVRERQLTIKFDSGTSAGMQWQFKPHQREIKLVPGETALAFYTARNPMDRPVTGIATYNVIPFEAGLYFNKIQCFCFEEQRLNPKEQVDMPVFFYIDPEFNDDPAMAKVDTIILSYTFFEVKEGEEYNLPLPGQPAG